MSLLTEEKKKKPNITYKVGDRVRRDSKYGMGDRRNIKVCPYCHLETFLVLKSHDILVCYQCNRVVRLLAEGSTAQLAKIQSDLAIAQEKIKNLQGLLDIAQSIQESKPIVLKSAKKTTKKKKRR
jgi:ribosomal protein L37AE/L43A